MKNYEVDTPLFFSERPKSKWFLVTNFICKEKRPRVTISDPIILRNVPKNIIMQSQEHSRKLNNRVKSIELESIGSIKDVKPLKTQPFLNLEAVDSELSIANLSDNCSNSVSNASLSSYKISRKSKSKSCFSQRSIIIEDLEGGKTPLFSQQIDLILPRKEDVCFKTHMDAAGNQI